MQRRLTVLRAPAGFGKTTVLTDIARATQEQGRIVGWLSLDDDDTPEVFGSYLAYAFERAGLDLSLPTAQDAWSSSPAPHQVGMLARAMEQHAAPCLLVLDEIDRAPPVTVHLIDRLLQRAPRNLHVALAFRSDPGLDIAAHFLDGEALLVSAEAFRFSTAEIVRFFGGELARRELAAVEERTAGWPVALMVHRNMRDGAAAESGGDAAMFTENYIGVRLLRGLSPEDRGHLLDLAVFDRVEADLVDDVLGSSQARVRITGLQALDGLLLPIGEDPASQRLQPLLRKHCLDLLEAEDLPRKCSLHERLALALCRRGELTPAWRHAREAGDRRLVGDLIERFGVFQLWLRGGAMQLISAGRYLTPEITESYPRLELLRCIYLRLSSRHQEAEALFESVARQTGGFARDRDGGDDEALAADSLLTRAMLAGAAAAPPDGAPEPVLPVGASAAAGATISRSGASARHVWLCVACHERADFEESRRHCQQARQRFSGNARFGRIFVDIYLGMSAMAQGRVAEATASYARARQGIRNFFPSDPYLTMSIDVLNMEINFERGRTPAFPRWTLKGLSTLREVWADIHIAALGVSAELTFEQHDGDAVIERLTEVADNVRPTGSAILSSNLSALLAYYLVEVGRPGEAGQVWRDHGLPCVASELLDLDRQSWRAMEALSCARVRLLAAQGECAAAEELASRLCSTAAERGLTRTLLRGLALSMVVADGAGCPDRARARLVEFLRLVAEVDYVRPMVRQSRGQPAGSEAVAGHRHRRGRAAGGRVPAGAGGRAGDRQQRNLHAAGGAGAAGGPTRPSQPGGRQPPRNDVGRRALPPEEHLPQDGRQQSDGRGALRAVRGRSLMTTADSSPPSSTGECSRPEARQAAWERRLLARARMGSRPALNTLANWYSSWLRRWARGRLPGWVRGAVDTSDVVQDALSNTFSRLAWFEPAHAGALRGYLRRAVENRIRDQLRRAAHRRVVDAADLPVRATNDGAPQLRQLLDDEAWGRYLDGLKCLNARDRRLIVGRVELGYNYRQLAFVERMPSADAARKAVRRALIRLSGEMPNA